MAENNDNPIMKGFVNEVLMKELGFDKPLDEDVMEAFDSSLEEAAKSVGVKDIINTRNNILIELKGIDDDLRAALIGNLLAQLPINTQLGLINQHSKLLEVYMTVKLKKSDSPIAKMLVAAARLKEIAEKELGEQE